MSSWQTIETAPKDGTRFLGAYRRFCGRGDPWMIFVMRGNRDKMRFDCVPRRSPKAHRQPTHWMPLPSPPSEPHIQLENANV